MQDPLPPAGGWDPLDPDYWEARADNPYKASCMFLDWGTPAAAAQTFTYPVGTEQPGGHYLLEVDLTSVSLWWRAIQRTTSPPPTRGFHHRYRGQLMCKRNSRHRALHVGPIARPYGSRG
jgi:hypothetical protein